MAMTHAELWSLREKFAKQDMSKARKDGGIILSQTTADCNIQLDYDPQQKLYSLYDFNTGEHLTTGSAVEMLPLIAASYWIEEDGCKTYDAFLHICICCNHYCHNLIYHGFAGTSVCPSCHDAYERLSPMLSHVLPFRQRI